MRVIRVYFLFGSRQFLSCFILENGSYMSYEEFMKLILQPHNQEFEVKSLSYNTNCSNIEITQLVEDKLDSDCWLEVFNKIWDNIERED